MLSICFFILIMLLFSSILKENKEFEFEERDQSALPDVYPVTGDETCYFLTKKTSNGKNKITVKVTVTEQTTVTPVTCLRAESPKKHNNSVPVIAPAASPNSGKSFWRPNGARKKYP